MPINVHFAGSGTSDTPSEISAASKVHSTEKEKSIPKPLKIGPRTIQDLFIWASYACGYDEETVRKIMKSFSITEFRSTSWWTYLALVRQAWIEESAMKEVPPDCPVCHSPVVLNRIDDRMFGQKIGWKCTASKIHFTMACWEHLKPLMTKRTDTEQFGYEKEIENA